MKQTTIVVKNVSKSFVSGSGVVQVLKQVSFEAYEHELILLLGPSGSGKTTLISIIGGILNPDEGDCLVVGSNMAHMSLVDRTEFRGKMLGFMFQHFMLIPTITVIENAAIPLLCQGFDHGYSLEKAKDLLSKFDLSEQLLKFPAQLSGGEQQRVAIARSCLHNPKVILCDEPTSYLDLERGTKVLQVLQDIAKNSGTTVIVITHDPRIMQFADRIIKIEDGRIVEDGFHTS